ncbi:MAG TPA: cytosine permease [Vicinamibacteria bacterium]|nr:cytosine permease [Vicinamibacteria bacterium]
MDVSIRPISHEGRTLGGFDYFVLWAGVAISLAEIWAGGFLAPMGFWPALWAILIGHAIGNTFMALAGIPGSDHGVMAMVSVRPSFGILGSGLAAILNVVQLVCWASIMLIIGARAGVMLGEPLGGLWASNAFWTILIGLGTLGWALLIGHRAWRLLQNLAVAGLLAVVVGLTVTTFRGVSDAAARAATVDALPFMLGVDLVIAMPISWMPLVADYARFSRPGPEGSARTFWATWWGYFLISSWMYVLGLTATLVTGTEEPHIQMLELMGAAGLALPALLLVVFSTITSDFPDIYSASCSVLNLSERVEARAVMWITGIVSILVALVFPMDRYESFLYFIGAMFVPLFGVVLTDYFFVRKRVLDIRALYEPKGSYWYYRGFHLGALAAWALGFGTYEIAEATRLPLGATLPSMSVSALTYLMLLRLERSG